MVVNIANSHRTVSVNIPSNKRGMIKELCKQLNARKIECKPSASTGKIIAYPKNEEEFQKVLKFCGENTLKPDLGEAVPMNSAFNNFHIKENTLKNEEYLIEKVLTMGANKVSFLKGKDSAGKNIYAIQVNNSIEYDVTEPELKQLVLTLDAFVKRKI